MALLSSVLFFLVLVALNYKYSKSLLYPPVIFSFVWLFSLIGLLISGDSLFSISIETIMVYMIGGLFFSLGGFFYFSNSIKENTQKNVITLKKINKNLKFYFDAMLIIFIISSIIYALSFSEDFSNPLYFANQRRLDVEISGTTRDFSFIRNVSILGTFLIITLHIHNQDSLLKNWRYWLVFITTALVGSLTGSKGILINLTLIAFFLSSIKNNKFNLKLLFIVLSIGLSSFIFGLLVLSYEYTITNQSYIESLMDNSGEIIKTVQAYWLGGLIAFNNVVENPDSLESTQNIFRGLVEIANNFGANYYVPSLHAAFTCISQFQCGINTYTIYFSYFKDYGWVGVIIGMFIYGFIMSWIYRWATQKEPVFVALYAVSANGLFFSFHAEHFFLNLNFMVKFLMFFYFTYYIVRRVSFKKKHSYA